ncbi:carboxypeptidase-like regulatory domain-containing protein, partial [Hymenobacter agri]
AWLAAAVALWGLREGAAGEAKAQTTIEWRARYWGGPVPVVAETQKLLLLGDDLPHPRQPVMGDTMIAASPIAASHVATIAQKVVFRGAVTDVSTNQGLPGVTVLVKGTELGVSTSVDGTFELKVPMQVFHNEALCLTVSSVGFITQERTLTCRDANTGQQFQLPPATMGLLEMMVLPPAPWHPRAFYYWGKYWLTRPFRRN